MKCKKIITLLIAFTMVFTWSGSLAFATTAGTPAIQKTTGIQAKDGSYTFTYQASEGSGEDVQLYISALSYEGNLSSFNIDNYSKQDFIGGTSVTDDNGTSGLFEGTFVVDKYQSAVVVLTAGSNAGARDDLLPQDGNLSTDKSAYLMPVQIIGSPDNLTASDITKTSATLTWGTVDIATGYKLYRAPSGTTNLVSDENLVKEFSKDTTSYTDATLSEGTTYTYGITACVSGNAIPESYAETATVQTESENPPEPPETPLDTPVVTAGNVTTSSIGLSWTAVSGASGYRISRDGTQIGEVTETNYTDSGLADNTSYTYSIVAYNDKVTSEAGTVTAKTEEKILPLDTPVVTTGDVTTSSIDLSWTAVNGASGYKISRNGIQIGEVTETSYKDMNLNSGSAYQYSVVAYNAKTQSASAGTAIGVTKLEVPVLTAAVGSTKYNSVKVSWTAVSGATGYKVYRSIGTGTSYTLFKTITSGAAGYFTNSSLATGTKYNYKIQAYGTATLDGKTYDVTSDTSEVKSSTPYLPATTIRSITAASKKLTVTWTKVAGASGYVVYRAVSKSGKYTAVKTITSGSTVKFINKSLKKKKYYYYKVRAYRKVGTKKVYANYSAIKYKKTK